jgi:hypothetical protein
MTIHSVTPPAPSLGETIEWFDAKGRSETGLPDYLDIDFRVWQDGRSGIYLTANQREVLAPTGVLFWTLKNGRLVFAARYRPAQSIASQTHGVVRLNDRNLASIQNKELSSLVRGMRVVRMKLDDSMYISIEALSAVHLEGTLRARATTVAAGARPPFPVDSNTTPVDPAASPVDRLRQLVTTFNTQYGELLPELEEMKPELSVHAAKIRARLEMTL